MTKVLLVCNFTLQSFDEEMILSHLRDVQRTPGSEVEFIVASLKPEQISQRFNFPSIDSHELVELDAAIRQADAVVVCGNAFCANPLPTLNPDMALVAEYPAGSLAAYLAALAGKPCLGYSILLDEAGDENEAAELRTALALCDWISVQDHLSIGFYKSLVEFQGAVPISAHPAFNIQLAEPDDVLSFLKQSADDSGPFYTFFLSYDQLTQDYGNQNVLSRSLDEFLEKNPGKAVLIPGRQDPREGVVGSADLVAEIYRWVKHKDRVVPVDQIPAPEIAARIAALSKVVVSMDPAGVIFALMAARPVIGLGNEEHLMDLMAEAGLEKWIISEERWQIPSLEKMLRLALTGQTSVEGEVQKFVARQKDLACESSEQLFQQIRQSQPADPSKKLGILNRISLQVLSDLQEKNKELHNLKDNLLRAQREAIEARLSADEVRGRIAFWVQTFWNLRQRFAPPKSRRSKFLNTSIWYASELFSGRLFTRAFRKIFHQPVEFEDRYLIEDFSQVKLFTSREGEFANYQPRFNLEGPRTQTRVSLISTTRNEKASAERWIKSIFAQTRLPDEIIIVDAGSSDGTAEVLNNLACDSPVPMRVIIEPGANISRGRNIAIEHAQFPAIAVSDFGCQLKPDWLENLILPFELDPKIEVVAGWYEVVDRKGEPLHRRAWPRLSQVDPQSFIPSSRSVAFTKEGWLKAGKYPEWLTLTGEDTYFALELKRYCVRWAFAPQAVVVWQGPDSARDYWKKIYLWSIGDGESGLKGSLYWISLKIALKRSLAVLLLVILIALGMITGERVFYGLGLITALGGFMVLWSSARATGRSLGEMPAEIVTEFARVAGFINGHKRRLAVDIKRLSETNGVFFILAGVPINDTGGGSRGTQIALELLRQKYMVVYINRFGSYEAANLSLNISHPNLFNYPHARFKWDQFADQFKAILKDKPLQAMVEFPLEEYLPLIKQIKAAGGHVAYDLLDDWNTSLGADWYDPSIERSIVQISDVLIATAPALVERMEKVSKRQVHLLPNAVNLRLFNDQRNYVCPGDLADNKFKIIYIGALWGSWFDWQLLIKVAERFKEAQVVVIGDYRGQSPEMLPNLNFLGLKPQTDLPAYLAYSDVAIIPWKVNKVTVATSPLKLYEYLAMGVPVVVPDLPLLKDIPMVLASKSTAEFLQNIRMLEKTKPEIGELKNFIMQNSWQYRVKQLVELLVK